MGLHLDERSDGGFALYIDGDFQFDTADEAIYHETMALPALSLARKSAAGPLRVLICGGGDGLALRECLRFPDVASVDLVDYDPKIVMLARERFAEINLHAFDDPRVRVHFRDAWEFLEGLIPRPASVDARSSQGQGEEFAPSRLREGVGGRKPWAPGAVVGTNSPHHAAEGGDVSPGEGYDVILCDFTVPRTPEQTRIFTREWYELLRGALAPEGVMALNAVSPQTTPEAFWCFNRTVHAAGLSVLPYRVCIPTFREHGYGAWAFLLAARRSLKVADLRAMECPIETRQADLARLWRGTRFHRAERAMAHTSPIHSLENDCLLALLLNPGLASEMPEGADFSPGFDIEPLLRAIPITHPYHTRVMIETLAEQVADSVSQIDMRRLVDALLRRAARLPHAIREELIRLRDYLSDAVFSWDRFLYWGARLFAALVILMTLANAIAPDNAFAKGSAGLGHSSISRGYSGSGSFGGTRTISGSAGRANSFAAASSRGSFGRTGAFQSHGIFTHAEAPAMHSTGFRTSYGYGRPVDVYGDNYNISPFHYYYGGSHYYFGNRSNGTPSGPQEEHKPLFAADDDLLVMDNGDIIVTLSDKAYLLVTDGKVVLRSKDSPDPLIDLYPDPNFFEGIVAQLQDRQSALGQAVSVRRDWLSWVGWTGAMLPAIAQDKVELDHMTDLGKRIDAAIARLGSPAKDNTPMPALRPNEVELFVDARLRADGTVALRQADGLWIGTDGKTLKPETGSAAPLPAPPALAATLRSVLAKLKKEMAGDKASGTNDLTQLQNDLASLNSDLRQYQSYQDSNGSSYEVDYGSDEIPVSDAISRTQNDITQTTSDISANQKDSEKNAADLLRLDAAAPALRP